MARDWNASGSGKSGRRDPKKDKDGWAEPPRDAKKKKGEDNKQGPESGPIWGAITKKLKKLGRKD